MERPCYSRPRVRAESEGGAECGDRMRPILRFYGNNPLRIADSPLIAAYQLMTGIKIRPAVIRKQRRLRKMDINGKNMKELNLNKLEEATGGKERPWMIVEKNLISEIIRYFFGG